MAKLRELSGDLVEEILCRVPFTSVKRVRSTCKRWNRLFNDAGFARKYSDQAAKQPLCLMLTHEFKIRPMSVINLDGVTPSLEVKGELTLPDPNSVNGPVQFDIYQIFHCDGFLLCTYYYARDVYDETGIVVWNPCTGQTVFIDYSANRNECKVPCFVLGYCRDKKPCSKRYKLLSYHHTLKDSEIYDFSSDSWRIVDDDIAPGWSLGYAYHSVSLKGNTYWFARDETETEPVLSLLRFDFSTEKTSGHVPLPYHYPSYKTANLSVVREEKLSVLLQAYDTSKTEVWVTDKIEENKAVVSWSKVFAFDLSPAFGIVCVGSFLLHEEKNILVFCGDCLVREEDNVTEKVYIAVDDGQVTEDEMDGPCPIILNYVPSFAQIETT